MCSAADRRPVVVDVSRRQHDPVAAGRRVVELLVRARRTSAGPSRLHDQRVAERLHVEHLGVRDLAGLLAAADRSKSRLDRTPPEFMNAATAPPKSVGGGRARASRRRSRRPSAARPRRSDRWSAARGEDVGRDRADDPVRERADERLVLAPGSRSVSASGVTFCVTMTFSAFALVITPAGLSSRSMSVMTRPNEAALVTSLSSIVQTYGWCVWALITTFTRSSSPFAIGVISGPLKFTHLLTSMNASGWFAGPGNTAPGSSATRPGGAGRRTP